MFRREGHVLFIYCHLLVNNLSAFCAWKSCQKEVANFANYKIHFK